MRRTFVAATAALSIAIAALVVAQGRPDFSGTWTLDQTLSREEGFSGTNTLIALPSRLEIKQTPDQLSVVGTANHQEQQNAVYRFDGTQTVVTGMAGKTTATAKWDGAKAVVTAKQTYPGPAGTSFTNDIKDVYSLDKGNLVVERTLVAGGIPDTKKFVFTKGDQPASMASKRQDAAPSKAAGGAIPRTVDGKPDMQGYWQMPADVAITNYVEAHPGGFGIRESRQVIVDPPDGKIPYQPWAAAERDRRRRFDSSYEDPEGHCFLSGLPRQMYVLVPGFQILQTPGYIAMPFEYIHAYRTIRLTTGPHLPSRIKLWEGDSIGHWDGDTLVVDTTNFNGKTWLELSGDFVSDAEHTVERFTLLDANTLRWEMKIEDPKVYTKPWTMVLDYPRNKQQAYEQWEEACHEGNEDLAHTKSIASPLARERGATRGDTYPNPPR